MLAITHFFRKPKPFPHSKHVIKKAFTINGVDYYEFDTLVNLPFKRGMKFLSIYNELEMRCDRFYLEKHVEAVENILTGGKKVGLDEITRVRQLNLQMKERLEMVVQEDLVYKIASVVFFDENENPDDWEWQYAMKKIERWKKAEGAADFFLREPIHRLIPFLKGGKESSQIYLELAKKVDEKHLAFLFTNLSGKPKPPSATSMQRYFSREMKVE